MTTEQLLSPTETESANTNSLRSQILQSLKTSPEYRHAFIEENIQSGLAAQIHSIREERGMDPKKFAEKCQKKISWIYRLEDPNAPPPTIPSLLEVAKTFDIALDVRFVPFSEVLDRVSRLTHEALKVPDFNHDSGLEQAKER